MLRAFRKKCLCVLCVSVTSEVRLGGNFSSSDGSGAVVRQSQNIWDSKVHLKPPNRTKKPETGWPQEKGENGSMKLENWETRALQHKPNE